MVRYPDLVRSRSQYRSGPEEVPPAIASAGAGRGLRGVG